jgi:hypothetical protein
MTNCKHEKELVCIECNADMTIKEMLDEARADERRIEGTRLYTMYLDELEIAKKEAYAKGKADLEAEIKFAKPAVDRFDELLRQEAYKKGQADLIGKLTSKEAVEAACEYWYGESELTDADTWQEVGKTTQDDYREMFKEIIEKAIKKASSISSEIGEKPPRKAAVSESATLERAQPVKRPVVMVGSGQPSANSAPELANKSKSCGTLTSGRAEALPSRQTLRSLTAPENAKTTKEKVR